MPESQPVNNEPNELDWGFYNHLILVEGVDKETALFMITTQTRGIGENPEKEFIEWEP